MNKNDVRDAVMQGLSAVGIDDASRAEALMNVMFQDIDDARRVSRTELLQVAGHLSGVFFPMEEDMARINGEDVDGIIFEHKEIIAALMLLLDSRTAQSDHLVDDDISTCASDSSEA